eukprot:Nk52_evm9s152 gene=Nk52_evmTU9s152
MTIPGSTVRHSRSRWLWVGGTYSNAVCRYTSMEKRVQSHRRRGRLREQSKYVLSHSWTKSSADVIETVVNDPQSGDVEVVDPKRGDYMCVGSPRTTKWTHVEVIGAAREHINREIEKEYADLMRDERFVDDLNQFNEICYNEERSVKSPKKQKRGKAQFEYVKYSELDQWKYLLKKTQDALSRLWQIYHQITHRASRGSGFKCHKGIKTARSKGKDNLAEEMMGKGPLEKEEEEEEEEERDSVSMHGCALYHLVSDTCTRILRERRLYPYYYNTQNCPLRCDVQVPSVMRYRQQRQKEEGPEGERGGCGCISVVSELIDLFRVKDRLNRECYWSC